MKARTLIFCTFCFSFFLLLFIHCNAQTVDSTTIILSEITENSKKRKLPIDTTKQKFHSPKKASWLAIIPGAGQIYNKKYWKLPIVYVGLGTTGALIYYYGRETSIYRKEYIARVNNNIDDKNPTFEDIPTENILSYRDYYRRNMEITVAACVVIYALSILDASVDAHFFYYDISDNLSLKVKPKVDYNYVNGSVVPSLAFILKF